MMPSLFIAHGAPLLAIQDTVYARFLSQLGGMLPRPKSVILFSAHWVASTQMVSVVEQYETIYDFGGFPEELYQITYSAKGDLPLSHRVQQLLGAKDVAYRADGKRGLDHGAWVILRRLYPDADIPVVSMSVNPRLAPKEQYEIGKALSTLRAEDVLIIGSGATVHNLRLIDFSAGEAITPWAAAFDEWIGERIQSGDVDALFQYESLAPGAKLAVPSQGSEHFIPLLYAMGAADGAGTAKLLHRDYEYGNLSNSVWQFG